MAKKSDGILLSIQKASYHLEFNYYQSIPQLILVNTKTKGAHP